MSTQTPSADRHPGHATGPRTPEGKAKVSRNAVTHGLTCRGVLLPEDNRAQFEHFRQAMIADGQPVGAEEQNLVERMVAAQWRLQRLWRQETGVFALARLRLRVPQAHVGVCLVNDLNEEQGFAHLARHEAALNREYHRCSRRLQELQALRRKGLRHAIEEDAAETAPHADVSNSAPAQPSASSDGPSREIAKQTLPPQAEPPPTGEVAGRRESPVPHRAPTSAPSHLDHTGSDESAKQTPVAEGRAAETRERAAAA